MRHLIETAFAGERINEDLVSYARTLRRRASLAALTNTWSFGRRLMDRAGIGDLFDLYVARPVQGSESLSSAGQTLRDLERLVPGPSSP